MNAYRAAVIIPHKDDVQRLAICLAKLQSQSVAPDELLVVDNGSKDSTEVSRVCAQHGATLVHCFEGGSYAARNTGIQNTTSELLIFTDADCMPAGTLVEAYKSWAQDGVRLLAAGPVNVISKSNRPNAWECLDIDSGYPQEQYVRNGMAITANLAVKRSAFERYGLFDANLFSGGDVEFTRRAASVSGGIDWIPQAIIFHPARATLAEHAERVKRISQGLAAGRIKNGETPVPFKTWGLLLIPPVARLRRVTRIAGATPQAVVGAFFCACCLRVIQIFFLLKLVRPGAVVREGGKYK